MWILYQDLLFLLRPLLAQRDAQHDLPTIQQPKQNPEVHMYNPHLIAGKGNGPGGH